MVSALRLRLVRHRRAVAGVTIVVVLAILMGQFFPQLKHYYQQLYRMREAPSAALYASVALLFVVACLTSVFPASVLGVLAGMLLGFGQGLAVSVGATLASALAAYVFSRFFFRKVTRRLVGRLLDLERLEQRLARHGWRYALLLRLAPIAPFSITSYGLGLTPLGLRDYLLTTMGALPFLVVCVYLGSVGGVAIDAAGNVNAAALRQLVLLFTVATVLATLVVYLLPRVAKRFLAPHE